MFVCVFLFVLCIMHVCVCVSSTSPVNGLYYHTIKSHKCVPEKPSPKKAFPRVAWPQRVCCMSCPSTSPSPPSSSGSRGDTTADMPFGKTKLKRLSVLQAVAQGYCPISQDDTEQDDFTGNQRAPNTKNLETEVVVCKGTPHQGESVIMRGYRSVMCSEEKLKKKKEKGSFPCFIFMHNSESKCSSCSIFET